MTALDTALPTNAATSTTRRIASTVVHGDAIGRQLGFPTANLATPGTAGTEGVWAALVRIDGGERHPACVSIGSRPTIFPDADERLVEVHLLDLEADLYGHHLEVELVSFLRAQYRFATVTELTERIAADVAATRQRLGTPARIPA